MIKLNIKKGSQSWSDKTYKETAEIVGKNWKTIYWHFHTQSKDIALINDYVVTTPQ